MKADETVEFSKTSFILVAIVVVVLASIAWVGCRDLHAVNSSAQDKAVLSRLMVLSSAADQYYLERGVSSVASSDLMGPNSSQYVKLFQTVANESYTAVLVKGQPITASGIAGARTITFGN